SLPTLALSPSTTSLLIAALLEVRPTHYLHLFNFHYVFYHHKHRQFYHRCCQLCHQHHHSRIYLHNSFTNTIHQPLHHVHHPLIVTGWSTLVTTHSTHSHYHSSSWTSSLSNATDP
ncbi:unnamed protein product, partial [Rangifer tarandus platyrhynchus]